MSTCYLPEPRSEYEQLPQPDQFNIDHVVDLLGKQGEYGWVSIYSVCPRHRGVVIAAYIVKGDGDKTAVVVEIDISLRH